MYLVKSFTARGLQSLQEGDAALLKRIRRLSPQVQVAMFASSQIESSLRSKSTALIATLAPSCIASKEAQLWAQKIQELSEAGEVQSLRLNPIYTLHAMDNLALSELSIHLGNKEPSLGMGSAPGQLWETLELLRIKFSEQLCEEALLVAGDLDSVELADDALGAAAVFSAQARSFDGKRCIRFVGLQETAIDENVEQPQVRVHSAFGFVRLLEALKHAPKGAFEYQVPPENGDGEHHLTAHWEVTSYSEVTAHWEAS